MLSWIQEMSTNERTKMIKNARKGGRKLRKIHISNAKSVISEVHDEMMRPVKCKRARKEKQSVEHEDEMQSPAIDCCIINEYVAVHYQDNWYPGCVLEIVDNHKSYVKFMTHCRTKGFFQWPPRDDKQLVNLKFVIMKGFSADCVGSSGRQWSIANFVDIKKLFELYMSF